jgi:hypothetical protein
MKYWGRSLIVYLTIITLLYGTKEVWSKGAYDRSIGGGGGPSHTTFDYEPDPSSYKRAETPIPGMGGQSFGQHGGMGI